MQGKKPAVRKVPMRKCIGCMESKPKKELLRVVHNKEGDISIDTTGKKPGRGAYICAKKECFQKARKSRALERAFSCAIEPAVYDTLEQLLQEVLDENG